MIADGTSCFLTYTTTSYCVLNGRDGSPAHGKMSLGQQFTIMLWEIDGARVALQEASFVVDGAIDSGEELPLYVLAPRTGVLGLSSNSSPPSSRAPSLKPTLSRGQMGVVCLTAPSSHIASSMCDTAGILYIPRSLNRAYLHVHTSPHVHMSSQDPCPTTIRPGRAPGKATSSSYTTLAMHTARPPGCRDRSLDMALSLSPTTASACRYS